MDNKSQHKAWTERYRPQHIKNIVYPKHLRDYFDNIVTTKFIPSMILYSTSPGTSKTSTAKALSIDVGVNDYLYINASQDGRVAFLSEEITKYVTVASMTDPFKVVILDEMEASSTVFQQALKAFIEQYSKTCSFILTTNNLNKIIDPLKSRCIVQDFNMSSPEIRNELVPMMISRLEGILKKEVVEYQHETIVELVNTCYPDLRKMISRLQNDHIKHGAITNEILNDDYDHQIFYQMLLQKKIGDARKYLIENSCDYDIMYQNLFHEFIPLIKDPIVQNKLIVLIAKYLHMSGMALDKEIIFTALLIDMADKY